MAIKQRIKKALNYISQAYYAGFIPYPRVDNDFIMPVKSFDLFPHPSFPPINKRFEPLEKRAEIKVNKEELVLFLSLFHIITPAQIEGVVEYIEYYLDDNFEPHNEDLAMEIELVIKEYESFLEDHNLTGKDILALKDELFESSRQANEEALLFHQESFNFYPKDEKRRAPAWINMKNKKADKNAPYGGVIRVSTLTEALDIFQSQSVDPEQQHTIKKGI